MTVGCPELRFHLVECSRKRGRLTHRVDRGLKSSLLEILSHRYGLPDETISALEAGTVVPLGRLPVDGDPHPGRKYEVVNEFDAALRTVNRCVSGVGNQHGRRDRRVPPWAERQGGHELVIDAPGCEAADCPNRSRLPEHEPGEPEPVHAHVQSHTAAELRAEEPVLRVVLGNLPSDVRRCEVDVPEFVARENLRQDPELRQIARPHRFHDEDAGLFASTSDPRGLGGVDTERLLDQNRFPRVDGQQRQLSVEPVGCGHVHGIHGTVSNRGIVRAVRPVDAEFRGECSCPVSGTRTDCNDAMRTVPVQCAREVRGDLPGREDRPSP